MTTTETACPHCGSRNLFKTITGANGGYGPALLPRLGKWFQAPQITVVVCGDCGLMRLFAGRDERARLATAVNWQPV